ncbi:MAG: glycosyltransferase family 1 protein [Lachnospiraceae bacterium]|nr:glycosyltransferase family 1 protein [Lachnospiraceae bacterium]
MKLILFKNTVETLEFFSFQIAKALESLEWDIFFYDCLDPFSSYPALLRFIEGGNTAAFSFNFSGLISDPCLCQRDGRDPVFFKETGIPIINMVVDHPYYYHEALSNVPPNYHQICIDNNHIRYMQRFFPNIDANHYLPLAGTHLDFSPPIQNELGLLPMENRVHNIVFTGNYVPPESYDEQLKSLDKPVQDFYQALFMELVACPYKTLEETAERRIKEAFGAAADDEYLKSCFSQTIFLDLKLRHYFRGQILKTLTDAGIKVTVFGSGYERLPLLHPENLEIHGNVDSERCLKEISRAKISLNVMPWFKDGTHDRVYSSMLNGSVCLSDHSKALDLEFSDGEDILFYDLKRPEEAAEKASRLLSDTKALTAIANTAYLKASKSGTWADRADYIADFALKYINNTNSDKLF